MEEDVPDDYYSFEKLWKQTDDVAEDMRNEIRPDRGLPSFECCNLATLN
jgi:hypothetical protein